VSYKVRIFTGKKGKIKT